EYRIFEGELTALLTKFLTPLDPATLQDTYLAMSNPHFVDVQLVLYDGKCQGFSVVLVTQFEPPLPLISNKMKFTVKMNSVNVLADDYDMTGSFYGYPVQGSGAMNLTLEGLVSDITFETDEFSSDPMKICVRHGSFNIVLSASRVTGMFEGMPVVNSNMNLAGPFLLTELQKNLNDNGEAVEEALNDILC
ncbi:hemolymph juvenile hormone binding, partial [Trinorchestia longiramus]